MILARFVTYYLLALTLSWLALATPAHAASVQLTVQRPSVHPGESQTVIAQHIPSGTYRIQVTMPDGETLGRSGTSTSGTIRWSFVQPPHTMTHHSRRATVHLTIGAQTYETHYTIAFEPIDVVVPYRPVPENKQFTIWIHTQRHIQVTVQLTGPRAADSQVLLTGPRGWASLHAHIMNDEQPFQPVSITVTASAVLGGRSEVARATLHVLPFQFTVQLGDAQILHQVGGIWVTTTTVQPGEQIRIQAEALVTEPAGNMPLCSDGKVFVIQGSAPAQVAAMHCEQDTYGTFGRLVADLQLSDTFVPGPAEVDIEASYENGSTRLTVPITITSG